MMVLDNKKYLGVGVPIIPAISEVAKEIYFWESAKASWDS